MKTASSIVSAVVKSHMIPEIETIIDEEKQVVHRKIADKIEKLFVNPEQISKAVCVTRYCCRTEQLIANLCRS
jgi:nucleosome binding factor SPN SPT16 subunit